ncbi:hypothetical protein [Halorussus sp. MSC15.2]|uniref:hypothetical protein n=1 Tax=Halorussus sp. MSC15.2 TaxID=2283638 RepID=UPI0013D17BD0|nr:hypothetical protein [Halorussus sp. MSC15.2]NEU58446.1 hypothetical protein [Halorussus sp. MSC15.2]
MPDERQSPSAGWREVYHEMEATADVEDATHPCPDCGRTAENVARDVYDCEEHGLFRAYARDGERSSTEERSGDDTGESDGEDADTPDERVNRTRGSAGPV